MELKDFVEKILVDIDKGVVAANEKMARKIIAEQTLTDRSVVKFDIAVAAESKKTTKAGAKIKIIPFFDPELSKNGEVKNSTVSRVQFAVSFAPLGRSGHAWPKGKKE